MKTTLSIRTHLIMLVLAVALPFVALIAYNIVTQARLDIAEAQAQASRAARAIAADTKRTLARAQALLLHLSTLPTVRALDHEHCDPIFDTFGVLFPQYTNLLTIRSDAQRVCSAVRPRPDTPSKVDPSLYLKQTLQSRSFTVGQVTRGIFSDRWILIVAQPLMRSVEPDSDVSGIVALSIDLRSLPLSPSLHEQPPGIQARIVDARGIVLGSTAAEQTIGMQVATTPDGIGSTDRIDAIAPISGTTWQVRVSIPTDLAYRPIKRRALVSGAVAALVLFLAVLLAYLISRRITQAWK